MSDQTKPMLPGLPEPTQEQRKAIRAFIDGTLLPLIGDVLEKKLTQAALFMRDELQAPPNAVLGRDGVVRVEAPAPGVEGKTK